MAGHAWRDTFEHILDQRREAPAESSLLLLTSRLAKPGGVLTSRPKGGVLAPGCKPGSVLTSGALEEGVACYLACRYLADPLEDGGDTHTPADAEGHEAVLAARAVEVVQELDGEHGTGGSDGVSERDRAAYRVELLIRHPELASDGNGYGGECLVRLDGVEIVDAQAAFFKAVREAGIMPVPMTDGSTPATAAETSLPATGRPSSRPSSRWRLASWPRRR